MTSTATTDAWTSHQVATAAHCTYRQLDYWIRNGVLTPSVNSGFGSGNQRRWNDHDVLLAALCARLAVLGAEVDILAMVTTDLAQQPPEALSEASWLLVQRNPYRVILDGQPDGHDAWVIPSPVTDLILVAGTMFVLGWLAAMAVTYQLWKDGIDD